MIAETTPAQTIGIDLADAISGVSLSETGNTTGETFTVTLSDSNGVLSTNSRLGGDGTIKRQRHFGTTLTIAGSLSQVNSDLATLLDTDSTAGTDTITLTATDSFGNTRQPQTIDVTVAGLPVIAAMTAQTIGVGQAAAIIGVNVSETGATTGETFTVTLNDSTGVLSATGGDGRQRRHDRPDHSPVSRWRR